MFLQYFLSSNIIKHLLYERYHVKYYAKYKERQDILLVSYFNKIVQISEFPIKFLPSISGRQGFQRIIKIHHNFIQREEIFKHNSVLINEHHILLNCSSSLKRTEKRCLMITYSNNDLKQI